MQQMTDLLRAFFDATVDAIVVVDSATQTVVEANAQALVDSGYRLEELDGVAIECLFPSLGRLLASVRGRDDLARGIFCNGARLLTKRGEAIAVDARVTPVALDDGHYFVIVARRIAGTPDGGRPDRETGAEPDDAACRSVIGHSEKMRQVVHLISSVAKSDTTVLIQGESGTGKEIVANTVHAMSRRRRGPFVKVNCAALTETLLESELFGHVKGAFTGALRDRNGRFKQADRGTILLDEIGSMPLAGQAALLRVLQEHAFEPVGSSATTSVDVRVIASTNTDLARAVADGSFRADLYYRLNVFGIVVPPLRDRVEDIPLLAQHFLERCDVALGKRLLALAPDTLAALLEHEWPGNVRELDNAIEHAVLVELGTVVTPTSLPATIRLWRGGHDDQPRSELGLRAQLNLAERQILLETLTRANGIKKRAAAMLGIDSRNMPYFLRKHQLQDAVRP